ncbi:MAG: hypothetical protein C3F13_04755 [Anaerolineales bacterium]|nr:MAG: hypothetical protein C3F13_04755 [Anaerolineales bacterium]
MNTKSKNKLYLMITILMGVTLLVGACTTTTPTPTATSVPPTAEPTAAPQVLTPISQADLTTGSWQWVSGREALGGMPSVVPDPENYTITFNNDNSLNIKADCNMVQGTYSLTGDQLAITLGASTLVACPPGSSSDKFLAQISTASSVGTGFGSLVIGLGASGGEMYFQHAPAAVTPPLDANLQPITQDALINTLWQWIYLKETSPSSEIGVGNPENYDLVFRADGTYSAKSDCNQLAGTYDLSGSSLTLNPGISSLAACPEDSKYDLYKSLLARVTTVGVRDGLLVLILKDNPASMSYVNAGVSSVVVTQVVEGDPATILGAPDGVENFRNTDNWTTFTSQCFNSEITDGQFVMTANGVQGFSCWEVSWPELQNFYIETTQAIPTTCQADDTFGMIFRAPDTNRGYLYGYNCAGQYSLTIWDGQATTTLVQPTDSIDINNDPGSFNRLGLLVFDGHLSLYANGKFLTTVTDFTFPDAGRFGYFVRAATENPFTVSYDQLRIWSLEDELFPPNFTQITQIEALPRPEGSAASGTAKVNVFVRTGPSMLFPILDVAIQGDTGEVLGTNPDGFWYAVKVPTERVGTGIGWVAADFVELNNPSGQPLPVITPPLLPTIVTFPAPAFDVPQAVMNEAATIRTGPTTEFPVLGVAPTGSRAEIIGQSQDRQWWAVRVPTTIASSGTGWVNKVYTSDINTANVVLLPTPQLPPNITPATPGSGIPAMIALEPLEVRTGPGSQYRLLGEIQRGTVLAVLGISPDGEWYVVNIPTSITPSGQGWVPVRFTQASNAGGLRVIQPPPAP